MKKSMYFSNLILECNQNIIYKLHIGLFQVLCIIVWIMLTNNEKHKLRFTEIRT